MVVPGGRSKRVSRGVRNSLIVTDEEGRVTDIGSGALREEEEVEQDIAAEENAAQEVTSVRGNSIDVDEGRAPFLLAGGLEDWEDVDGKDVDR